MKKGILGIAVVCFILTGCTQHSSSLEKTANKNPTSITITKYESSNKTKETTYTLSGTKLKLLYQAIQNDAKHVLPNNASISCPSYSSSGKHKVIVWNYDLVVHYSDHSSESFKQYTVGH